MLIFIIHYCVFINILFIIYCKCYRKKLDVKTNELQNKVKYWVELACENRDIPQVSFKVI